MPFAALVALLALTSCQKEYFSFRSGTPVKFGATSSGTSLTRTAYSGVESGNKERIDWQAGDTIRIYCAEASEPAAKWADYTVSSTGITSSGQKSEAALTPSDGGNLCWGDEGSAHVFYAVYPSPATEGKSSDKFPGEATKTTATCTIPSTQDTLSIKKETGSHTTFTAVPDLTSEYMVAKKTISAGTQTIDGSTVFLSFKPVVTAIEFTVINGSGSPMDIDNISLTSKGGRHSRPVHREPVLLERRRWLSRMRLHRHILK